MAFVCSICGETATQICARCTKDACGNHICEKCLRCSDCCECEVALTEPVREAELAGPSDGASPEPPPESDPAPSSEADFGPAIP